MKKKGFYAVIFMAFTVLAVFFIVVITLRHTKEDLKNGVKIIQGRGADVEKEENVPVATDIFFGETPKEQQTAFEKWGDIDMDAEARGHYPEGFRPLTPEEQAILNEIDNIYEDMLLGDDGEEGPCITDRIETDRKRNESYAMLLCRMAFRYDKGMPYMESGAEWGGMPEPVSGCPESIAGFSGTGNAEYVQMLYMYTFGYVPDILMDMDKFPLLCAEITIDDLNTGDIAVMELPDGRRDIAVCVGVYQGSYLFSHCVNTADSTFSRGCSKICYAALQKDAYYRGNEPGGFTHFYQSPVRFWGAPDENMEGYDRSDEKRILIEISEGAYGSDAAYLYADKLIHEIASGNPESFLSDFAAEEIRDYGYQCDDEAAYRRYLRKIYETVKDNDYLYVAFVNDRGDHYNAAIYGLNLSNSGSDVTYDYDSLEIVYFTIYNRKKQGFSMLPFNTGTLEYNYGQYGLAPVD